MTISHCCLGIARYLVVDSKVTDLHRYGDEVDDTVELVLFKFLLQIYNLFLTERRAAQENSVAINSVTVRQSSLGTASPCSWAPRESQNPPRWHLCLGLLHEVDHAGEVDQELQHDGQDGVEVEDVGQWPLVGEGSQRLGKEQ